MITDQDVTKLKKTFTTKREFKSLENRFDVLEGRFDRMEFKLDKVMNTLDTVVGAIQDIREDNAVGLHILMRHERQVDALAVHTKFTLPE